MINKFLRSLLIVSLLLTLGVKPALATTLTGTPDFRVNGVQVFRNGADISTKVGSFSCHAFWKGYYTMNSHVNPHLVMSGPTLYSGTMGLEGEPQVPFAVPMIGRKPALIPQQVMQPSSNNMVRRAIYIGTVSGADGKEFVDPRPLGGQGPAGTPAITSCPTLDPNNGWEPVAFQNKSADRTTNMLKKVGIAIFEAQVNTAIFLFTVQVTAAGFILKSLGFN